jgi:hypothetical protein
MIYTKEEFDKERENLSWLIEEGKGRQFTCKQCNNFQSSVLKMQYLGYSDHQSRRFTYDVLFY